MQSTLNFAATLIRGKLNRMLPAVATEQTAEMFRHEAQRILETIRDEAGADGVSLPPLFAQVSFKDNELVVGFSLTPFHKKQEQLGKNYGQGGGNKQIT